MDSNEQQSRRAVLRAATAAFGLAASGLLLTGAREDVAGADGVMDGKRGGRRRKNRGGRDKDKRQKRQQRRKARKRDKAPQGPGQILDVLLYVHNLRGTSVSLRAWRMIDREMIAWEPATDTITLPARPASGPEPFHDFVFDVTHLAVSIDAGHVIEVSNPWLGFPWAFLATGTWGQDGWNQDGQQVLRQGFAEGESKSVPGFVVQRLSDSATHKRFLLNLV